MPTVRILNSYTHPKTACCMHSHDCINEPAIYLFIHATRVGYYVEGLQYLINLEGPQRRLSSPRQLHAWRDSKLCDHKNRFMNRMCNTIPIRSRNSFAWNIDFVRCKFYAVVPERCALINAGNVEFETPQMLTTRGQVENCHNWPSRWWIPWKLSRCDRVRCLAIANYYPPAQRLDRITHDDCMKSRCVQN